MRNSKGQFIKGNIPFTKGKPRPLDVKEKLSLANIGKKQSAETIAKRVSKLVGQKRTEEQRQNISESRKGKPNGHLGLKRSKETKNKIAIANTGKIWDKERRIKFSLLRTGQILSSRGRKNSKVAGKNNFNWKGGVTPENEMARKSIHYKLWQKSCMERDKFICQKYGIGGKLHVHHINNFADFPELRYAINNGITLSEKAHKEFHRIYGNKRNTPEQLEEFLNIKIPSEVNVEEIRLSPYFRKTITNLI